MLNRGGTYIVLEILMPIIVKFYFKIELLVVDKLWTIDLLLLVVKTKYT